MQSRSTNVRTTLIAFLIALSFASLGNAQNFPTDLNANIPWTPANFNTVGDIQAAFNNGRTGENTQLGTTRPLMTMPSQAEWDAKSNSLKALWLINEERVARGVLPLQDVDINVIGVAQNYANFLLANNVFNHTANGQTPEQRLDANPAINGHRDFLGISENLSAFVTSTNSIPMPVERSIYGWIYDDAGSTWGHRHACLWIPFTNNFGVPGSEGLMGIGRASGGPWSGFGTPWNFAEIIVFNVFDPNATYSNPALPVQLSSFTGNATAERNIRLRWTTISEINNYGFFVQRRAALQSQFVDLPNSFLPGHGTTNVPQQYELIDIAPLGGMGFYRLKQVDLDGSVHYSDEISISTLTGVNEQTPVEFSLNQNYPNPFNPTTVIRYALPVDARVTLEVYDMLGRRVAELVNGHVAAGYHDVSFDASNLASGLYTYRLQSDAGGGNNFMQVRKLMVLK